jgi:hypothetical protein
MSNPAPNLETAIYDRETAIETAVQTVLTAAGVASFIQREADPLTGIRVNIQWADAGTQGHESEVTPGQFAFDAWLGQLRLEIITPRYAPNDANYDPTVHGTTRGTVRLAMQYFRGSLNADVLPYHVLVKIREAATQPSVVVEEDSDLSAISFDCILAVRTGAWPV